MGDFDTRHPNVPIVKVRISSRQEDFQAPERLFLAGIALTIVVL